MKWVQCDVSYRVFKMFGGTHRVGTHVGGKGWHLVGSRSIGSGTFQTYDSHSSPTRTTVIQLMVTSSFGTLLEL